MAQLLRLIRPLGATRYASYTAGKITEHLVSPFNVLAECVDSYSDTLKKCGY